MAYSFLGTVEHIIFDNPNNHFKIVEVSISDTDADFYQEDSIIVTGTIGEITLGDLYTFFGEIVHHPKYGEQLQIERYEKEKPTASGLINYFSSPLFKGIGKKTAKKIVDLYGENAIDAILEAPEQLEEISGLSAAKRRAFVNTLASKYESEKTLADLYKLGLSHHLAIQIQEEYHEEALSILKENPYLLIDEIKGVGFPIADRLAETTGLEANSTKRLQAALLYTLSQESFDTGDTFILKDKLLIKARALLQNARSTAIQNEELTLALSELIRHDQVKEIDNKVFESNLYFSEQAIHDHITRILETPLSDPKDPTDILNSINHIENESQIHYDDDQKRAIQKALLQKLFIITGGPGTGKTTLINGIIQTYADLHTIHLDTDRDTRILLAAPTGRAARRMSELTGLPSATIHRHLGLTSDDDDFMIEDDLDCDLLIIDEFSMVDTFLATKLFSRIADHTQVIIVGDSDQLPSVGPGQILSDLLNINLISHIKLSKIYRQSDDSTIVTLANHLKQGILPDDFKQKKADRTFIEVNAPDIIPVIEKVVTSALASGIAKESIQILAPMYRGKAGIDQINRSVQNLLNPQSDLEFQYQDQLTFRKNDKIIQLVNDAENNVFNGDIGYITDLIPAKYTESKQDELYIAFEQEELIYPRSDWGNIKLAYAMSIHKSQGSEFPVVILPITNTSKRMLKRNLIYTAITRSKEKLILLGNLAAFEYAVQHDGDKRQTHLVERFDMKKADDTPSSNPSQDDQNAPYRLTEDNYSSIDPLIGLEQADFDRFFKKNSSQ